MNKKISSHLQYRLWLYLVSAAVVFVLWTTVFYAISSTKYDEKVSLMLFCDEDISEALRSDIEQNITDITSQQLKEIIVEGQRNDLSLMQSLVAGRIPVRDLFVFSESVLTNTSSDEYNPLGLFAALKEEKLEELFGDCLADIEFFRADGYAYGVYLNDPNDGVTNNFERMCGSQTRYVLLFSYESLNMGGAYGRGDAQDTAAVDIVKYLISE